MLKVLTLTAQPRLGPSARYRVYAFREPLRERGVDLHISPFFTDPIMERWISGQRTHPLVLARAGIAAAGRLRELLQAGRYDVIYLHRQAAPFSQWWFDPLLERTRVPLVFDMDDAVFEDYPLDALLRRSVAATVGNRYLAGHVARVSPHTEVTVLPTAVDLTQYRPAAEVKGGGLASQGEPGGLVVGWVGTPSTFQTYLAPALPELVEVCRAHGAAFRVITNAVVEPAVRAAGAEFVPWSLAREVPALQELDIGVMPLSDNRHVRGKCAFKLIQYGAVGLPSVGTDIGANGEVLTDGQTGFLTTSPQQMAERVGELLRSPQLRASMGHMARATIEREFSLAAQVPVLEGVLRRAALRGQR